MLGDGVVHVDDTVSESGVIGIETNTENSEDAFFGRADQYEFRWFIGRHNFLFFLSF